MVLQGLILPVGPTEFKFAGIRPAHSDFLARDVELVIAEYVQVSGAMA